MSTAAKSIVEELTDGALKKRIAVIDRLKETRQKHIEDLQAEVIALNNERAVLVRTQIERLQSQLPQEEQQ